MSLGMPASFATCKPCSFGWLGLLEFVMQEHKYSCSVLSKYINCNSNCDCVDRLTPQNNGASKAFTFSAMMLHAQARIATEGIVFDLLIHQHQTIFQWRYAVYYEFPSFRPKSRAITRDHHMTLV